ncbi:hypothetical protein [Arenibaculum pallidiluteum]|uniref:hypothetical protein n=1 Tax=Arenibaculum pallidiluteum TaxID=2812559 RepID=UPI001A96A528|nr:hypothetical protein [Arenibaculum pallidiluteum]
MSDQAKAIRINRAPVLALWAAVVAERLGLERSEALTFGRALSGLTAHAKGVHLGIFEPTPERIAQRRRELGHGDEVQVGLMGRAIPAVHTPKGLMAVSKGKPIAPASVERYLAGKFGDALEPVRAAMAELAGSQEPAELARSGFRLCEQFRPAVKPGAGGWGQEGELDLERIRALARR